MIAVLERARTVGFLGPGPLHVHIDHALRFAEAISSEARSFLDLGSGGGLPGLPLALARPEMQALLVDASQRRTAFLQWAASELGITGRVEVVRARAEVLAHDRSRRHAVDVVVSRGFGPPSMTLECARSFVAEGGMVIVSEPPLRRSWPADGLSQLGLELLPSSPEALACFNVVGPMSAEFPRSAKIMKRVPILKMD